MENTKTIGDKVLALRKAKGYTQADLGQELNVSYQAVSKWERGEACPDFDTISKIARLFNVPISYFESEETELAPTAAQTAAEQNDVNAAPVIIGVCRDCGVALKEGEQAAGEHVMRCKACSARKKRELEMRAREEVRKKQAEKAEKRSARNRGLIWGGVMAGILLALGIMSAFADLSLFFSTIVGTLLIGAFIFMFVSQLFWDGAVVHCATNSWHVMMPGIIFEFSLDGFIFLIVVKILFALIRALIAIVSLIFCIIVAILISPFTFFFALRRINREGA